MANQLNPDKEKIIFAEWSAVRTELKAIRKEMSRKKGREISEAEFFRTLSLQAANNHRRAQGKSTLDLDPSSTPSSSSKADDERQRQKDRQRRDRAA